MNSNTPFAIQYIAGDNKRVADGANTSTHLMRIIEYEYGSGGCRRFYFLLIFFFRIPIVPGIAGVHINIHTAYVHTYTPTPTHTLTSTHSLTHSKNTTVNLGMNETLCMCMDEFHQFYVRNQQYNSDSTGSLDAYNDNDNGFEYKL